MNSQHFANTLLRWYPQNKRELPWRNTKEPYIIWLSEIILQQTRVAQGQPFFEAFISRYPDVHRLAEAPIEEVMRLWQGLGYYSRARNLHACAQEIAFNRNGRFPATFGELRKLKGVGNYTAAAIASFAYGQKIAVVDGNVYRVLSRYFGIALDIASSQGQKAFADLANRLIPEASPDEYNQAIMEFGALQCVPKKPDCDICPLLPGCFAQKHRMVEELPVKTKKVRTTQRVFLYFHITAGDKTFIKERGPRDIWQGLVDFPLEELQNLQKIKLEKSALLAELKAFRPRIAFDPEKNYRHILTHQTIFTTFVRVHIPEELDRQVVTWGNEKGFSAVTANRLEKLGKPKPIVSYLKDQNLLLNLS